MNIDVVLFGIVIDIFWLGVPFAKRLRLIPTKARHGYTCPYSQLGRKTTLALPETGVVLFFNPSPIALPPNPNSHVQA